MHILAADSTAFIGICLAVLGFALMLSRYGKKPNHGSGSRDYISGVDPDED